MDTVKRNLLEEFTKKYFEKLFYFCLEKDSVHSAWGGDRRSSSQRVY